MEDFFITTKFFDGIEESRAISLIDIMLLQIKRNKIPEVKAILQWKLIITLA